MIAAKNSVPGSVLDSFGKPECMYVSEETSPTEQDEPTALRSRDVRSFRDRRSAIVRARGFHICCPLPAGGSLILVQLLKHSPSAGAPRRDEHAPLPASPGNIAPAFQP